MDPVVSLRGAVALTGRFPALSGADLSVGAGEVVSVVGANGAGKTTLLRVCAGLLAVAAGEAVVLGVDLRDDPAAIRRHVGLLGRHRDGCAARRSAGDERRIAPGDELGEEGTPLSDERYGVRRHPDASAGARAGGEQELSAQERRPR